AALLLSLRSDDRPLRPRHHARDSSGGRGHRADAGLVHLPHGSSRETSPESRVPNPEGNPVMWSGIPLFPERASTMAGRVDALYFFLVAIAAFFSLLIAGLIVYYAVKYRRRAPDAVGTVVHGGIVLEIAWTVIPLLISMVIFV